MSRGWVAFEGTRSVCVFRTKGWKAPRGTAHGAVPERRYFFGTFSSSSFAIMSSADVAGLTALSTAAILPSLPM